MCPLFTIVLSVIVPMSVGLVSTCALLFWFSCCVYCVLVIMGLVLYIVVHLLLRVSPHVVYCGAHPVYLRIYLALLFGLPPCVFVYVFVLGFVAL